MNDSELLRACLQYRTTTVAVLVYDTAQAIESPEFTSMMRTHAIFRFKLVLDWPQRWAYCTIESPRALSKIGNNDSGEICDGQCAVEEPSLDAAGRKIN